MIMTRLSAKSIGILSMLLSHRTIAAVVDIPSALLPTSLTNDQYGIDCDGSRYGGYDLDAEDCLSAFHLIIDSDEELQFADRHSRAKELNMAPLPWRWMGGMYHSLALPDPSALPPLPLSLYHFNSHLYLSLSPVATLQRFSDEIACVDDPRPSPQTTVKGSCYFQPILKPGAEVGSTTLHDIRGAAYLMIGKCAMAPGHPGGIATKIR